MLLGEWLRGEAKPTLSSCFASASRSHGIGSLGGSIHERHTLRSFASLRSQPHGRPHHAKTHLPPCAVWWGRSLQRRPISDPERKKPLATAFAVWSRLPFGIERMSKGPHCLVVAGSTQFRRLYSITMSARCAFVTGGPCRFREGGRIPDLQPCRCACRWWRAGSHNDQVPAPIAATMAASMSSRADAFGGVARFVPHAGQ